MKNIHNLLIYILPEFVFRYIINTKLTQNEKINSMRNFYRISAET